MHTVVKHTVIFQPNNHNKMFMKWSNLLEGFGVTNPIYIILISQKTISGLSQKSKPGLEKQALSLTDTSIL